MIYKPLKDEPMVDDTTKEEPRPVAVNEEPKLLRGDGGYEDSSEYEEDMALPAEEAAEEAAKKKPKVASVKSEALKPQVAFPGIEKMSESEVILSLDFETYLGTLAPDQKTKVEKAYPAGSERRTIVWNSLQNVAKQNYSAEQDLKETQKQIRHAGMMVDPKRQQVVNTLFMEAVKVRHHDSFSKFLSTYDKLYKFSQEIQSVEELEAAYKTWVQQSNKLLPDTDIFNDIAYENLAIIFDLINRPQEGSSGGSSGYSTDGSQNTNVVIPLDYSNQKAPNYIANGVMSGDPVMTNSVISYAVAGHDQMFPGRPHPFAIFLPGSLATEEEMYALLTQMGINGTIELDNGVAFANQMSGDILQENTVSYTTMVDPADTTTIPENVDIVVELLTEEARLMYIGQLVKSRMMAQTRNAGSINTLVGGVLPHLDAMAADSSYLISMLDAEGSGLKEALWVFAQLEAIKNIDPASQMSKETQQGLAKHKYLIDDLIIHNPFISEGSLLLSEKEGQRIQVTKEFMDKMNRANFGGFQKVVTQIEKERLTAAITLFSTDKKENMPKSGPTALFPNVEGQYSFGPNQVVGFVQLTLNDTTGRASADYLGIPSDTQGTTGGEAFFNFFAPGRNDIPQSTQPGKLGKLAEGEPSRYNEALSLIPYIGNGLPSGFPSIGEPSRMVFVLGNNNTKEWGNMNLSDQLTLTIIAAATGAMPLDLPKTIVSEEQQTKLFITMRMMRLMLSGKAVDSSMKNQMTNALSKMYPQDLSKPHMGLRSSYAVVDGYRYVTTATTEDTFSPELYAELTEPGLVARRRAANEWATRVDSDEVKNTDSRAWSEHYSRFGDPEVMPPIHHTTVSPWDIEAYGGQETGWMTTNRDPGSDPSTNNAGWWGFPNPIGPAGGTLWFPPLTDWDKDFRAKIYQKPTDESKAFMQEFIGVKLQDNADHLTLEQMKQKDAAIAYELRHAKSNLEVMAIYLAYGSSLYMNDGVKDAVLDKLSRGDYKYKITQQGVSITISTVGGQLYENENPDTSITLTVPNKGILGPVDYSTHGASSHHAGETKIRADVAFAGHRRAAGPNRALLYVKPFTAPPSPEEALRIKNQASNEAAKENRKKQAEADWWAAHTDQNTDKMDWSEGMWSRDQGKAIPVQEAMAENEARKKAEVAEAERINKMRAKKLWLSRNTDKRGNIIGEFVWHDEFGVPVEKNPIPNIPQLRTGAGPGGDPSADLEEQMPDQLPIDPNYVSPYRGSALKQTQWSIDTYKLAPLPPEESLNTPYSQEQDNQRAYEATTSAQQLQAAQGEEAYRANEEMVTGQADQIKRQSNIEDGLRPDGSKKGTGWLGVQKNARGEDVTEYTVGVQINGKEMDIPTLVPSLSKDEVTSVLKASETGSPPSDEVIKKAVDHAREQLRIGAGVFAPKLLNVTPYGVRSAAPMAPVPTPATPLVIPQHLQGLAKKAEDGDIDAQVRLARNYKNGQYVKQDSKQALYWFTKAAEQGDGIAMSLIGDMYASSTLGVKDEEKAVYWYKKAHIRGSIRAKIELKRRGISLNEEELKLRQDYINEYARFKPRRGEGVK